MNIPKAAIVRVSYEMLADALALPDGIKVTCVETRMALWHEFIIRIEGDALPEYCKVHGEGSSISEVIPIREGNATFSHWESE